MSKGTSFAKTAHLQGLGEGVEWWRGDGTFILNVTIGLLAPGVELCEDSFATCLVVKV